MNRINWGIIGCGDVTEIKSGPAFNKVPNSALVAVMRRNAEKAADYAKRHNVPKWYNDATQLINDPEVNAIYIATPPSSHEEYAIAAINAGKPVYVEKPMALNYESAKRMADTAEQKNVKLVVAHYRREWPMFKKIKELINDKIIGEPVSVRIEFYRPPMSKEDLADEKKAWRVNPAISGGGLFHDLAPHQLDIMYWLFGGSEKITGHSSNRGGNYAADDTVNGYIEFANGIQFNGDWNFIATGSRDLCEINGSNGRLCFSFFETQVIEMTINDHTEHLSFEPIRHVQQPMIERVVQYFMGKEMNPCRAWEGLEVMRWMESFIN